MKTLHFLPLVALLLSSCASAVFYSEGKAGNEMVAIAPGLLSQQMLKGARITTPKGLHIEVDAYAGRTDPAVTGAVRDVALFKAAAPIIRAAVDGANATALKGTEDVTLIKGKALDNEAAKTAGEQALQAAEAVPATAPQ